MRLWIGTGFQTGSLVFSSTSIEYASLFGSGILTVTRPKAPLSLVPHDQICEIVNVNYTERALYHLLLTVPFSSNNNV